MAGILLAISGIVASFIYFILFGSVRQFGPPTTMRGQLLR